MTLLRSAEEQEQAARNANLDLLCDACASVWFTGNRNTKGHAPTCATTPALRAQIDMSITRRETST